MNVEKILRYEIYKINDYLIVDIPLLNLEEPSFSLDNKTLYIYLESSTNVYYLENLPDIILEAIKNKICFIKEITIQDLKYKTYQVILS